MAGQRRSLRLLALLAAAALLLLAHSAAAARQVDGVAQKPEENATATEEEPKPKTNRENAKETAVDGKQAAQKDGEDAKKPAGDEPKEPEPKAAGGKKAEAAPAPAPAPIAAPVLPVLPAVVPPVLPAAAPAPEAAPAATEGYCQGAAGAACQTVKLIFKVAGAPPVLSEQDAENVMAAVNSVTAPVAFVFRGQQPSEPGGVPAMNAEYKQRPTAKAPKEEKPKEEKKPKEEGDKEGDKPKKDEAKEAAKEKKDEAAAEGGTAGADAAADPAAADPAAGGTDPTAAAGADPMAAGGADPVAAGVDPMAAAAADPLAGAGGDPTATDPAAAGGLPAVTVPAAGGARRRSSLRRSLLQAVVAPEPAAPTEVAVDEAPVCKKPQFEVTSDTQCTDDCNKKTVGKTATVAPETKLSDNGAALCCSCHFKRDTVAVAPDTTVLPSVTAPAATDPAASAWWPSNITMPLRTDGVFVFSDGLTEPFNMEPVMRVLMEATASGLLCSTINDYGVNCDALAIMFQGGPDTPIVIYRGTEEVAAADSGGGLSTAAIIGIAVGAAVLLAAIAIVVSIFVSRRRERAIDRAARQRTMSRKQSSAAAGGGEGESRWRAMYAQRMEDSMRRAEDAAARQSAAANGPSFVEVQDREFQRQAAASAKLSGPAISKKSYAYSADIESELGMEDSSMGRSLMAGSEVSSAPPSVGSTRSMSKKGSGGIKKLFGKK